MNKRVIVMELLLKWFHYKQILFFPEDGTYLVGILIFSLLWLSCSTSHSSVDRLDCVGQGAITQQLGRCIGISSIEYRDPV